MVFREMNALMSCFGVTRREFCRQSRDAFNAGWAQAPVFAKGLHYSTAFENPRISIFIMKPARGPRVPAIVKRHVMFWSVFRCKGTKQRKMGATAQFNRHSGGLAATASFL